MATPDRDSLANGLVRIGEDAVAKSNDALFYDYYTDDYQLHSPAGAFNRDEIRAYFAALRDSFTDMRLSSMSVLVQSLCPQTPLSSLWTHLLLYPYYAHHSLGPRCQIPP